MSSCGLSSGFVEVGAEVCTDIDCAGNTGEGQQLKNTSLNYSVLF